MRAGPGIQKRLIVLVLVSILPFAALAASLILDRLQRDRGAAEAQALAVARALAARLDDRIGNVQSLLFGLSHSLSATAGGADANDRVLGQIMGHMPGFVRELSVVGADGHLVGTSSVGAQPRDALGEIVRQALVSATPGQRAVIGRPFPSPRTGDPTVLLASPILDQAGRVVGAVSLTLDLGRIQEIFNGQELPPGGIVHIVDDRGIGVGRNVDPAGWIGRDVGDDPSVAMVEAEPDRVAEVTWPDGVARLTATVASRRTAWSLTVGIPSAVAYAASSEQIARTIPVSIVILALALTLAAIIAKRIIHPIEQLTADAAAFGSGNLSHRTGVHSGREVNALAEAFNRMAERVEVATTQHESVGRELRALIDASPVPIIAIDRESRVSVWNPAAERVFGYTAEETLGRASSDIEGAHPAGMLHRFLVAGPVAGVELRQSRKDGRPIDVAVSAAPLDDGGEPRGMVSVWLDLTERRLFERRLLQAQKMEAVGQLTAGLAHDLNNALGAVVANLDLLAALAEDRSDLAECAERALEPTLKAVDLVQRLTDFSKGQQLVLRPVAVGEVLQRLVPLIARSLGERIEVEVSIAPDLWTATADEAHLEQCILNLAANAGDAMENGGKLSFGCRNVTVDADAAAAYPDLTPGRYVVLSVSDTGSGIDPEVLPRVFEPFFTTKSVGEGQGLGLSVVYGYVQQSSGMVKIYSERGRGTTVRLYLPPSAIAAASAAAADDEAPPVREAGRVLLAEDNPDLRRVAVAMLRGLGYEVTEVASADRALEVLTSGGEAFDLLFTDIVMPGKLTGIELARMARERNLVPSVLFASGFASPMDLQERVIRDGERLIRKPYRKGELAEAIRAVRVGSGEDASAKA